MLFSIITPCYNSSKTLMRTYESLKSQSFKDFEWILVDDASTDNTRQLILELAENASFPIKYILFDENHFGSKSVYEAACIATGKFACILDHDDELLPTTLHEVSEIIKRFDVEQNTKLAGVCGRCVDETHKLIGRLFKENFFISNEGDIRFKKRITCELFQFTKVPVLKSYFSMIKPGYTNGFCWAKISECYGYVYTNTVFRVYDTALESSYSNLYKKLVVYPRNKRDALEATIKAYRNKMFYNPFFAVRMCSSYVRHCFLSGSFLSLKDMPLFYYITLPLTVFLGYLKSLYNLTNDRL